MSNTGDRDGKATVELYAQTPYTDYDKQNNVEKSSIQLLGYDKIDVAAGASETVTVDVPGYFLASYDANGAKGYILDAGDYYFAVGNGAHEALNNVLAVKCGDAVAGKLIDQDGNVVTGNTAAVATWTAPQHRGRYRKVPQLPLQQRCGSHEYLRRRRCELLGERRRKKSPTCPAARGIRPTPPRWRP